MGVLEDKVGGVADNLGAAQGEGAGGLGEEVIKTYQHADFGRSSKLETRMTIVEGEVEDGKR